jgi:ribosomal protein L22
MYEMSKCKKRAADSILRCLKIVAAHAKHKGFDLNRMWIRDGIVNKAFRIRGIYYHAKMKYGTMYKDWSSILIRLEERPVD